MKNNSLIEGPIFKGLLFFSIPVFFSMLFQTMYNTIDTILIGHYLGDNALAAIGSTASIFELIVLGIGTGFGTGFGIVIARFYGSNDENNLKKSVASSIVWGTIISILITVITLFILPTLLRILNTPEQIMEEALSYIRIIVAFGIVTMFYNLGSGMLRSIGDSITPFLVLLFSSVVNVVLDIVCITVLNLGVQGAAIATVIAQTLSIILCLFFIVKKAKILIPSKKHFVFDKELLSDMLGQGASMAMMTSIVSVGSIILQSGINGFGTSIIAGHVAARKLDSMMMLPIMTFAMSISTFVSQNKGANQPQRIRDGIKIATRFGFTLAIVMAVVVEFFAPTLVVWLSGTSDPEVIANGSMYMRVNLPFFTVLVFLITYRNALQGLGRKIVPLISSIIECIGKVAFTLFIIPALGYFGVCICEPVIWVLMTIQLYFSLRSALSNLEEETSHYGRMV